MALFWQLSHGQSAITERDFEYGYWGVRQERLRDILSVTIDGKKQLHHDTGYQEAGGKSDTMRFTKKEETARVIISYLFDKEDRLFAGEKQYDAVVYTENEIGDIFFSIKKQYDQKYGNPKKYNEKWGDPVFEKNKNYGLAVLLNKLTIEVLYIKNKTQIKLTLTRSSANLGYSIKAVFLPYPKPSIQKKD